MVYQRRNYEWAEGFSYKVSPDIVGGVLEEIEERDGTVTREAFLEESRPKSSPTHELFEWDNKKAADLWRLSTSQRIINSLRVTIVQDEDQDKTITYSAYVNISDKKSASYVNVKDALENEENRQIVLDRAIRELKSFEKKYQKLSELSKIFKLIEEL